MSTLNPEDPKFINKMYQYNKKFRDYVTESCRNGEHSKDEVLRTRIAHEVALYYFHGDNTEEPEVVQSSVVPSC